MNPWEADRPVDAAGARARIAAAFPELADATVDAFGEGWDNAAFLVDDRLVFRFPRRQVAVAFLRAEITWLGSLSLPFPTSAPSFSAIDAEGWPFAGYPLLNGIPCERVDLDAVDLTPLATALGRALAALHAHPVPDGAPPDTLGRGDLPKRFAIIQERLAKLRSPPPDAGAGVRLAERLASTAPYAGPPRWAHGDLYGRHVLVTGDPPQLSGIIDWGDLHAGDPTLDLAVGYTLFDGSARAAFFAAYGAVDRDAHDRARFRALHYGAALLAYGEDLDDDGILALGRRAWCGGLST